MKIDKEEQSRNTYVFGKKDLEKALKHYLKDIDEYSAFPDEKTRFLLNGKDCAELSVEMVVIHSDSNSKDV